MSSLPLIESSDGSSAASFLLNRVALIVLEFSEITSDMFGVLSTGDSAGLFYMKKEMGPALYSSTF